MESVGYSQAANSEGDDFDVEKGLNRKSEFKRGDIEGEAIQFVNDEDEEEGAEKLNARDSV